MWSSTVEVLNPWDAISKSIDISETKKTASWEEAPLAFGYKCSNCGKIEEYGFPVRSITLGNFCPNCGFKMTNPKKIEVRHDVD